jgi:heavy metal translocating P-type ATPase
VPVEQVQVGDIVLVRTGDRVPVDGTVQAGQAAVDESAVTGESMPVDKGVGAAVFAGSLNRAGVLEVRAEKVGRDSTLGQIIRLVEEAQDSAAPIQRLADRYARYYVPAALLVAAVVYGWTHELVRAITILVVFCPCALVLATPAAVVAGIGNAARRVILIKGGVYLEQAGRVGMVAFDKTGTLTHGRPEVTDIVSLDTLTPPEVLSLAAAAERFSEHPIGQAIVRRAQEEGLAPPEPEECHVRPGAGIEARVNGRSVLLGRMELLAERHIPLPPESHRLFEEFEQAGRTVLPVAVDQQAVGLLALRDTLRPEVPTALQRLRGAGVQRLALLTGDNHRVAEAVAREAGISEVYSGLFPEDKLALVRQWQAEGYRVAVVGDGVNDAPALVAADLGIAMGAAGTDVAVDASDITLLSSELHKIPEVVDLSRRALAVIHQNIGFSVVVNVLAVVLASLGWLNPAWGAAVHESSAMLVLLNSMRLLHYRPRWASARAFTPTVSR